MDSQKITEKEDVFAELVQMMEDPERQSGDIPEELRRKLSWEW